MGFRPLVYQLAQQFGLNGWVLNAADGLQVTFNADPAQAERFAQAVLAQAPPLARITRHRLREVEPADFQYFIIQESTGGPASNLLLAPDLALCPTCQAELADPENRRFGYPFITCTTCGPRYSILTGLPYDRPLTSMAAFTPCPACQAEYETVTDRRFFSQTNSCPTCGPELWLTDAQGRSLATGPEAGLAQAVAALAQGQIVAVLGVGGYLLMADAAQAPAVRELRRRKHRPSKPLAVLFPDLAQLERHAHVRACEAAALQSPAAPIVLLPWREAPEALPLARPDLTPGLAVVGAMLPNSPLLARLAQLAGKPLVATSGNRSGSPIAYQPADALARLSDVADCFVHHARAVRMPLDDSVMRFTRHGQRPILLRRARGYAPGYYPPSPTLAGPSALAFGAALKSSLALAHRGNVYLSQFLGDLDSYEAQLAYQHVMRHLTQLLGAEPQVYLADTHPAYFSTQLATDRAAQAGLPLVKVPHHQAHLAAVLHENAAWPPPAPVLGVVWDGTGHGEDGHVWGGEFFRVEAGQAQARRVAHLAYFPFALGDKLPREPRLSALAWTLGLPQATAFLRPKFTDMEWSLFSKMLAISKLYCSSAGRLFDAVASLLGLADRASYEGEAALYLEQLATQAYAASPVLPAPFPVRLQPDGQVATRPWAESLLVALAEGQPIARLALQFHVTLVETVNEVAQNQQVGHLAFSGGVFQNALLVDLLEQRLAPAHTLYFHHQLPPNDENIALGQWAWWQGQTHLY